MTRRNDTMQYGHINKTNSTSWIYSGFTIVELLVVIVVIAILASVTVVAFNGVQNRAVNSQILAAVDADEKALMLYNTTEGHPVKSAWNWGHISIVNMAGVCIGGSWKPNLELADEATGVGQDDWDHAVARNSGPVHGDYRDIYCGQGGGNSSVSRGDSLTQINDAIAASETRTAFANVPGFKSITLKSVDKNNNNSTETIRGVRYSYNNYAADPTSYLFYPFNGKVCSGKDTTVRLHDTIWASDGGDQWTRTFENGGNYTVNDTSYCMRTIKY